MGFSFHLGFYSTLVQCDAPGGVSLFVYSTEGKLEVDQFLKETEETQTNKKRPKWLLIFGVWVSSAQKSSSLTRHQNVRPFIYRSTMVTAMKDSRSGWSKEANFPLPSNVKMRFSSEGVPLHTWLMTQKHTLCCGGGCHGLVWFSPSLPPVYPVCSSSGKLKLQSVPS